MKYSQARIGAHVMVTEGSSFNAHLVGKTGHIMRIDRYGTAWPIVVAMEGDLADHAYDFDPDDIELIRPGDFDLRPNWSIARAGAIMAGVFLALLALLRRR